MTIHPLPRPDEPMRIALHTAERVAVYAARLDDADMLASMNQLLIRAEGSRNPMPLVELAERMRVFLSGEYRACMVTANCEMAGYCLFRPEGEDVIYIRQLFIHDRFRKMGIGRALVHWLSSHVWPGRRTSVDVLAGNAGARAFWRAVSFVDYSARLEAERVCGRMGS